MKKNLFRAVLVLVGATVLSGCNAHHQSSLWMGQQYQQNSSLQASRAGTFFFPKYKLNGSERILDIGSGVGNITEEFRRRLGDGSILGIDKSKSMVETASQSYPPARFSNLLFEHADAQDPGFYAKHANEFDWVVSFSCLHWVRNHVPVFEGISTVLKEGGKTYLFFASTGGDPIAEIANKMTKEKKWAQYFEDFHDGVFRYDDIDYRQIFEEKKLPFEVVTMKQIKLEEVVDGREALITYNRSWVQQLHRLPTDALKNEFLEKLADAYLRDYPADSTGKVKVVDHYIEVVLKKRMS